MKPVQAYSPKCCTGKSFIKSYVCKRHEQNCPKNPDNKACATCAHRVVEQETVYVRPHGDQNYGDADYDVNVWYCSVDGKELLRAYSSMENGKPLQMHCESYKDKDGESQLN